MSLSFTTEKGGIGKKKKEEGGLKEEEESSPVNGAGHRSRVVEERRRRKGIYHRQPERERTTDFTLTALPSLFPNGVSGSHPHPKMSCIQRPPEKSLFSLSSPLSSLYPSFLPSSLPRPFLPSSLPRPVLFSSFPSSFPFF